MVKQNFLTKMLLLCALIVGSVSSAWATDVTITFGTGTGAWAAHSNASYNDSDSRTWSRSFSANNQSSGQTGYSQFGNSSNACTSLVLTATAGIDMTVTAFSVKMAGASGGSNPTTGTIYLYKKSGETEKQLATVSVSGSSDVTCSISSSEDFSSTDVLKVSYVGTNKAIRIKELKYSYTMSGGGEDSDFALTDAPITLNFDLYGNADAQVINYTTSSTGAVTIADSEYATFSINTTAKTITVTPTAVTPSAQTITVNQEADDDYNAGSATFTLNVADSTPFTGGDVTFDATKDKGTSPLTKKVVTFACDNGVLNNGSEYRLYKNSNTTFSLSEDAINNGYVITSIVFTCTSDNPASGFATQTGWTTNGDNGTWTGSATSVSFLASNKQVRATKIVVTVGKPAALSSITLSGEYPTTFHQGDAFSHEGMTVTATYEDETTKDVTDDATFSAPDMSTTGTKEVTVSYTENEVTKTATYNITVNAPATLESITLSGEYTTTFTQGDAFDHDGVVVTAHYDDSSTKDVTDDATFSEPDMLTTGTKTVTVSYGGKTATYEITVNKAPAAKRYKLVTEQSEIAEGYNYLIVYDTNAFAGVSSNIGQRTVVTVSEDDIISNPTGAHVVQFEAATDGNFYIKDGDDYLVGPNSNGLYTTTDKTEDGTEWTITPNDIINVDYSERGLRYNTSSPRFCNYKPGNTAKDVVLYRQFDNVTITAAEYATFCGADALDFNETGIKAFTATDGETSVKLNEFTSGKVPANTPVVLYKEGLSTTTTFDVPVAASADAFEGTNDLHVSDGTTAVGNGIYVLAKKNEVVGFYPWTSTVSLSSGKIYLQSASSAPFLGFDGEGTTGIQNIERTVIDNQYYTLDGRRVAEPTKGLYIINGKKVVIK